MLNLHHVSKTYGSASALCNISLDIAQGSMVAVLGGSGAGKSTLLRLINRFIDIDKGQGSISYNGQVVSNLRGRVLRQWRSRCGMVFQNFNLSGRLDVITNVLTGALARRSLPAALFGVFSDADHAEAIELINQLGLRDFAFARADSLSGGQQQRVAIARTLMQRPQIILADEPIAALDPHNATAVMDLLANAAREHNITVICNLHQPDTAIRYCDRIVGLKHGRVAFDGAPAEFTPSVRDGLYQTTATVVPSEHAAAARVVAPWPVTRAIAV